MEGGNWSVCIASLQKHGNLLSDSHTTSFTRTEHHESDGMVERNDRVGTAGVDIRLCACAYSTYYFRGETVKSPSIFSLKHFQQHSQNKTFPLPQRMYKRHSHTNTHSHTVTATHIHTHVTQHTHVNQHTTQLNASTLDYLRSPSQSRTPTRPTTYSRCHSHHSRFRSCCHPSAADDEQQRQPRR